MTGLWAVLGIFAVIAGLLWRAKKAGKDQVRADNAEATVEAINKANAPLSDPELERVRARFRRP